MKRIETTIFKCDFCSMIYEDEEKMKLHESRCICNSNRKTCVNCKYFYYLNKNKTSCEICDLNKLTYLGKIGKCESHEMIEFIKKENK